jgi:hypothetical protein
LKELFDNWIAAVVELLRNNDSNTTLLVSLLMILLYCKDTSLGVSRYRPMYMQATLGNIFRNCVNDD